MADSKPEKPQETEPTPEEWLALLKKGVDEFNRVRQQHPKWTPHFPSCPKLSRADLRGANLQGASLHRACLQGTMLQGASLSRADLRRAEMAGADLRGADLERADLSQATLDRVDARGASLQRAKGLESATLDGLMVDSKTCLWGIETSGIRPRYPVLARIIADAQFVEDFRAQHRVWASVWRWTCDYGRSWMRWACWALVIALAFGVLFTLLPGSFELRAGREPTPFTYFYFSIVTFTTLGFGDVVPKDLLGEVLLSVEVVLGYVMLGGLISILATKLARRS